MGGNSATTVVALLPSWGLPALDMAASRDVTRVILACLLLTILVGPWLSHWLSLHAPLLPRSLRQAYAKLPLAKRDEWNTRVWSSLHAILVSG